MPTPAARRQWLMRSGAVGVGAALAGGASLAALVSGCSSLTPISPLAGASPLGRRLAEGPPALSVGDEWHYRLTNLYNHEVSGQLSAQVVAVRPEVRVEIRGYPGGEVREERGPDAWTLRSEATFDLPLVFESPMAWLDASLTNGVRRQSGHYRIATGSRRLPWQQQVQLEGVETLDLPAGRFECLRVVRLIWFEHPDFFRIDSRRVDRLWYAPAARRWVKREWSGDFATSGSSAPLGRSLDDQVRFELVRYRVSGA